ncbi:hypothetical protein D3C80_97350 [compost metagenome]
MTRGRKPKAPRLELVDEVEVLLDMSLPEDKPKDHHARWAVEDRLLAAQFGITVEELLG